MSFKQNVIKNDIVINDANILNKNVVKHCATIANNILASFKNSLMFKTKQVFTT